MIETRDHRLWSYELDSNMLENRSMWDRSNARHVLLTNVSPVGARCQITEPFWKLWGRKEHAIIKLSFHRAVN